MLYQVVFAAETPSTPDVEVHPGLRKEGLAPFKLPPHPLRRLLYGSGCRWLGTFRGSHATCAPLPVAIGNRHSEIRSQDDRLRGSDSSEESLRRPVVPDATQTLPEGRRTGLKRGLTANAKLNGNQTLTLNLKPETRILPIVSPQNMSTRISRQDKPVSV